MAWKISFHASYCPNPGMKCIITGCLALITLACMASDKKEKKEPPQVVIVKKSAPVLIPSSVVKKNTPAKYRDNPVPKGVMQKFKPPVIVKDSVKR
jgi:hypothetical protein